MSFPQPLRAVVTGAGSGLGRALALDLAKRSASLVVSDINVAAAEETAELVRQQGATAEAVQCDVTDREAVFDLIDETEKRLGGIDFIANNAGVAVGGPFEQISIEDWRWAVDINLWGVIYGCQAAIPKMKAQGRGYILNVASAAGLLAPPAMSAYNVTKAGVVSLSETLFAEYKPEGIRVAVLCPTFFRTNIVEAGRGASTDKEDAQIIRWMERSKVQAPEVAKGAIDAVRDGKLYVQPMRDGRVAWRLKRTSPQRFYDSMARAHQKF
ncbi:MAG: SDR family NAD(P)-dependent oxidoreductase, partial [Deltaproteobacteria bacterium]|nr:SDR family NAD(P)-dependent oxidoreductase [Deltaproteobacteria bacterium]MBW2547011.1 SDR family NAD(P)-dependent oxidoreductase [Deltaproteobacteria bacterium]